jgi:hypothetical protein
MNSNIKILDTKTKPSYKLLDSIIPNRDWGQRLDGRIEWYCKHGIGHTIWWPGDDNNSIHGCDGCCSEFIKKINKENK